MKYKNLPAATYRAGYSVNLPMKQYFFCKLIHNTPINAEIFSLDFAWPGAAPRAGQFFMIKPKRSSLFLPRPISAAFWDPSLKFIRFLIARRGKGTGELAELHIGEEAALMGPLGNAWDDFLSPSASKPHGEKPIALIGGGAGIAPLEALAAELSGNRFDFYAGFKTGFRNPEEKIGLLGPALAGSASLIIAAENGEEGLKGLITDFLNPADYSAVCACGPEAMLRTAAEKCAAAGILCYVSLERRMACGVGACLGCTAATAKGNRRCCADGPIFPAAEVFF